MKRSRQTGFQKRNNDISSHSDVSTTRHKEDGMMTNKGSIEKENKTRVVMMPDRPFATSNYNTPPAGDAPTVVNVHLTMTSSTRMEDNREKPSADGKIVVLTSGGVRGEDDPTVRVQHLTMTSPTRTTEDNREKSSSASDDCAADGDISVTSGVLVEEEQEREEQNKKDDQDDQDQDHDHDDDNHDDGNQDDDDDDNNILDSANHVNLDGNKLKRNRVMAKERRTTKEKMNKLMKERIQELTLCNNKLRWKNDEMIRELASVGVDVLIHPLIFQQPDFDGESKLIGPGQVPLSVHHIDHSGVELRGGSNLDAMAVDPAIFGPRNMVITRDSSHPGVQDFVSRPPSLMWNQGGINELRHQHTAANGTFPPLHEFGGSSSAVRRVPGYTGAASLNQRPIGFGPQPQRSFVMPFQTQDHFPRPDMHAYHSPAVLATSYQGEAARPNPFQEQMHSSVAGSFEGCASPQNATMRDAKRRAVSQVENGHPNLLASTAAAIMTGIQGDISPFSRIRERAPLPQNEPNKRNQNPGSLSMMASPDLAVATFLKQLKQNDDRHRPTSTHINQSDPSLSPAGDATSETAK